MGGAPQGKWTPGAAEYATSTERDSQRAQIDTEGRHNVRMEEPDPGTHRLKQAPTAQVLILVYHQSAFV
jgi:hypothetical protein